MSSTQRPDTDQFFVLDERFADFELGQPLTRWTRVSIFATDHTDRTELSGCAPAEGRHWASRGATAGAWSARPAVGDIRVIRVIRGDQRGDLGPATCYR